AAGVGRVRGARVPVGAAGAAGRDHADVRVASVLHGPRVGLAGRDVPRDTARRRPRDVLHRGAVLRVEEAGRAPFGDGFAGQAGAGRGHVVAAVLQGGRDLLHVLRPGGAFSRPLGLVIGVHGALVVGADLGVEVRVHDVEVETRDVLAEEGDVLLNTVLELGHLLLGTDALPLPGDEEQAAHDAREHDQHAERDEAADRARPGVLVDLVLGEVGEPDQPVLQRSTVRPGDDLVQLLAAELLGDAVHPGAVGGDGDVGLALADAARDGLQHLPDLDAGDVVADDDRAEVRVGRPAQRRLDLVAVRLGEHVPGLAGHVEP